MVGRLNCCEPEPLIALTESCLDSRSESSSISLHANDTLHNRLIFKLGKEPERTF